MLLEQQIKAQPEYWLWSHRRWKHKREIEGENNTSVHSLEQLDISTF
jgi:lauroyl/myristoyl acyltransferase